MRKPYLLEETRQFILDRRELYYNLVEIVSGKDDALIKPGIRHSRRPVGASRRSYHLPEKLIESDDEHRRLQLQLELDLKAEYPEATVYCEGEVQPEGWFVDVVHEEPHRRVLYEIKTDPRLHLCLRSALGQLLQYAYWGNRQLATELVIVSRHALDQEGAEFLETLRTQYSLPISYRQVMLAVVKEQVEFFVSTTLKQA